MQIRQALSKSDKEKVFRLRYEVFCKEQGYLSLTKFREKLEYDEYDQYAVQYIALNSPEEAIGTVRLILSSSIGFPVNQHFGISRDDQPEKSTAEVSRLIVQKKERSIDHRVMLYLCKAIYDYSIDNEINYWYAILDNRLIKLFERLGFIFKPVAEGKFCYGDFTTPYILSIEETMANLAVNNIRMYRFFGQPRHIPKSTDYITR